MTTNLEVFKDIPGYKAILRSVLKSQIQLLVHQLSEHTGDETVVITANVTEHCHGNLGSTPGNKFLQQNTTFKEQFLNFCLGHHDGTSRFTQQPSGQSPKKSPAQNLFKLKPDVWKSTLRNWPYTQKSTRRALKSPAKPCGSKGHLFENQTDVDPTVNENEVKAEVDASLNGSLRSESRFDTMISGPGHEVGGHTYGVDIEERHTETTGSPLMDAEGEATAITNIDIYLMTNHTKEDYCNHPAVPMPTNSSIVTRSSKRKSAMPSRRYQDPYALGARTLSSKQSRDTTQPFNDSRATTEPTVEPDELQDLFTTNTRDLTMSPRDVTVFPRDLTMSPRNVTVSPGLILHNSSPAQPLETFVPIVEPQDITDPSTDDEREATSSHSPFHYKSSPAPPLVVMETKEESRLLPGYGGVVFPEPSPSPLSSPSGSTQQASVTIPQQSPNPDVMLVSRGERRYEKVINCQICGKMCRTSNMARHRKRYCLLSPEREEVLDNNSLSEHCQICGKVCRISNMARHRKRCCLLSPKREEVLGNNSLS